MSSFIIGCKQMGSFCLNVDFNYLSTARFFSERLKLWRKTNFFFRSYFFIEMWSNNWMLRNVHWHLIQSLMNSTWVSYCWVFFVFIFCHWIRPLQESASSESKLQVSTPPCFALVISCLPNVTIWNRTIAVWPWTTAVTYCIFLSALVFSAAAIKSTVR